MLGGVPFGQRGEKPGFGSFWEVSWVLVCPGSFPALYWEAMEVLLERLVGWCWSPVAAHAVGAGCESHTSQLPQHRGGHITHSCHCPHLCGHGCSMPVNNWLSLSLDSCTLNLLKACHTKRAMLSSGQRLKTPLDLLFLFPSGAFLPIRCLLLVWEQPGSCRCPWCGWWADEKGR